MARFANPFTPSRFDLVVTRHAPLVQWLRREGYIDDDTPVVEHAHAHRNRRLRMLEAFGDAPIVDGIIRYDQDPANVRGKHVIGVLPHHLSAQAASVTEVQLDWTLEDRKAMQHGDLDVDAVARAARGLHTYVVQRVEVQHMHSLAVAQAWRHVERHGASFGGGPGLLSPHAVTALGLDPTMVRGLDVDYLVSGDEQASAQIIMSRGLWRPNCRGPWLDGLGREVSEDEIEPAAGH